MEKVRLVLTLVTIAIVVIPIFGMVLAYQGNLVGLFVPPEMNELGDDLMGGEDGSGMEPPTMVGEPQFDLESRTFSVTFEYTNSFPMDITVKSLTGNIECQEHGFPIGNASLSDSVSIAAGETGTLTVVGSWTEEAVDHCEAMHADEEMIDVVLVDLAVDFSGVQIQLDPSMMQQGMQIPNPALLQE
jgi:hypothetical protein